MTKWLHLSTVFSYANARLLIVPMVFIVAISTTIFLSVSASAEPGINKTVGFQGRLQRSSGAIVPDGYYNIQFKIYQDGSGDAVNNTGGELKWTESHVNDNGTNGVRVKNGYFSVDLGSKTAFGNDVDWNQDTLWLSMNVAGTASDCTAFNAGTCIADGEMLPMKRLTATPFAINSSQLDGKTADKFAQLGQGVQTDASDNSSIFINKTGNGGLMRLQNAGTDVLSIAGNGNITMGSSTPQSISVADSATGDGQSLTLSSGSATTGDANGGDLVLAAGSGSGAGSDGQIVMASDVTVSAGKTITMVGGSTAMRPANPSEGTMYFDSTTGQLLIFAKGKWTGGNNSSLRTVAASDSPQLSKDNADFIADGSGDQAEIMAAIADLPSGGGTVALLGGTYNINSPVNINKSNVNLQGQGGQSTGLSRSWSSSNPLEAIVVVPSEYSQIKISGLYLNGNKSTYPSITNHGIRVGNIDTACGSNVKGITIDSNYFANNGGTGIKFGGGTCQSNTDHTITNNTVINSGESGIRDSSGGNVMNTNVINNVVKGSGGNGINITGNGTVVERNKSTTNSGTGITSSNTVLNNYVANNSGGGVASATVLRGNTICDNTGHGFTRQEGVTNLVEGNVICNNTGGGVYVTGNSLVMRAVADNTIYGNGGAGIFIGGGSQHVVNNNYLKDNQGSTNGNSIELDASLSKVTDNTIIDSAGTGSAIRISGSNNFLSNNTFSGQGANGIHDQGTGTSYSNQVDASGKLINRTSGGFSVQDSSGSNAISVDSTSGDVAVAGTLKSGDVQTTSVDTLTADPLSLAASNATSVTIGASDDIATNLVLDTKNTTGDPSGVDGAMYYNSSAGAFRCYQAGSWRDCITPLPIYKTTASDTTFDNTETDIDDLEFDLAANTKYHYKFVIKHDTVNDNEGAGFGITSPSGSTGINWCVNTTVEIAATTPGPSSTAYCGTGDVSTVIDGSEIPGEKFVSVMEGYIQTGSNSGNLQLRALAEGVAGGKVLSSSFGIVQIVQ